MKPGTEKKTKNARLGLLSSSETIEDGTVGKLF